MATIIYNQYANAPNEKVLDFIIAGRNAGASVAGMYCGYAPVELVRAVGAALAQAYLKIPCSCMTSDQRRYYVSCHFFK